VRTETNESTHAGPEWPRSVVLIEDDAPTRAAYRRLLEICGWNVHEEADGVAGVHTVRRIEPDVVVTDLIMPGMDGCEVARTLRNASETRAIPIIAATGEITRPRAADRHLFDSILRKPFEPRELIAAIEGVCPGIAAAFDARRTRTPPALS
jgi:two-component system phosphate regulon response regulator PhoB